MTKLNQIIAVVNGKKTKTTEFLTELYKKVQKPELFNGLTRTYQPMSEDGETKPPEVKRIQENTEESIKEFRRVLSELIDVVYVQDKTNCEAKATVSVDGKPVVKDVPVTHLLYLEKQLGDLRTFVNHLPVLDPTENWTFDSNKNQYVTDVARTNATKKVLRAFEKAPATDKHPAQVETFNEDIKVGEWNLVKSSTALPAKTKKEYLGRVEKLIEAVKLAREQANNVDTKSDKIGDDLLKFVFEG